jgi:hypothetical protein
LSLLSWKEESFAYADSYDEANKRYRGLRCAKEMAVSVESAEGFLVKSDVAAKQQADDAARTGTTTPTGTPGDPRTGNGFGEPTLPGTGVGGVAGKPPAARP